MNKNLDIQLLQDTIDDLKNNPNACTTIGGMTSTDGTFTIPESNPGEKLSRFIQYFLKMDLQICNMLKIMKKLKIKK